MRSRIGFSRLAALLIVGAVLFVARGAVAVEVVVMRAVGVALSPGQQIDGTKPLRLPSRAQVTLITHQGRMIRLKGPYNDVPVPATGRGGDRLSQSLSALVQGRRVNTAMVGVSREIGNVTVGQSSAGLTAGGGRATASPMEISQVGMAGPQEPWVLDVTRSGRRCVHGTRQPVVLWRSETNQAEPIKVQLGNGAWTGRAEWPRGFAKVELPGNLPRLEGETYEVAVGERKVNLTLSIVPEAVTQPTVQAAWMLEQGCRQQAKTLLTAARSTGQAQ